MKRNPVFHIAMAMYSLIYFVPLLWMALSALKSNAQITNDPLSLPTSWDFSVFAEAFTVGSLGKLALAPYCYLARWQHLLFPVYVSDSLRH